QGYRSRQGHDLLRQGRLQADPHPATDHAGSRREGLRGRVHAAAHLMRAIACALLCLLGLNAAHNIASAETGAALSGVVSSAEEGAMEGVLVSAQRQGSPITVTVVSDETGRYRFPADRLSAGRYGV